MKLKLKTLISSFLYVSFKRFLIPSLYLIAVSLALTAEILNEAIQDQERFYIGIALLATGFFYSLVIGFFSELKNNKKISLIGNLILFGVIVLFYLLLPEKPTVSLIDRIFIVNVLAVTILSLIIMIKDKDEKIFWSYNFSIVKSAVISFLLVNVLFSGLALAFGIIQILFDVHISWKVYSLLYLWSNIFIGGTLFLSMFPAKDGEVPDYPAILRILVFYVLLPLTVLYLAIMYFYLVKVIVNWSIPNGEVSYMVLGFSMLGMLSLVAVYPLLRNEKYKFAQIFGKYFYYAVLPLIILLFVAVNQRIKQYGITENRYFLIAFALWLAFVAVYMIIKRQQISIISKSLLVFLIITGFGPWSAFNVSKKSQLKRLENIVEKYGLLTDNSDLAISDSDYDNIFDIAEYLASYHGKEILEKNFDFQTETTDPYQVALNFRNFLIEKALVETDTNIDNLAYNFYVANSSQIIDLSKFDIMVSNINLVYDWVDTDTLKVKFDNDNLVLTLQYFNDTNKYSLKEKLQELANKEASGEYYDNDILKFDLKPYSGNQKISMNIRKFTGYFDVSGLKINDLSCDIFVYKDSLIVSQEY